MSSRVFGVRSVGIQGDASLRQVFREVGVSAHDAFHYQVDWPSEEFFQVLFQAELAVE